MTDRARTSHCKGHHEGPLTRLMQLAQNRKQVIGSENSNQNRVTSCANCLKTVCASRTAVCVCMCVFLECLQNSPSFIHILYEHDHPDLSNTSKMCSSIHCHACVIEKRHGVRVFDQSWSDFFFFFSYISRGFCTVF